MWLALDTATDRASVALGFPGRVVAEQSVTGSRQHAVALLPMVQTALARAGASLEEIEGIALADGPGSFTGLRVGATVAKALAHARGMPLWTAPSLKVMAAGAGIEGGSVLALTDALRGELYAAAYRFLPGRVETILAPTVLTLDQVSARVPEPGLVVSTVGGRSDYPNAARLLDLVGLAGGAQRVGNPGLWEPEYGRPAEAQARWEKTHGRSLPDSSRAGG